MKKNFKGKSYPIDKNIFMDIVLERNPSKILQFCTLYTVSVNSKISPIPVVEYFDTKNTKRKYAHCSFQSDTIIDLYEFEDNSDFLIGEINAICKDDSILLKLHANKDKSITNIPFLISIPTSKEKINGLIDKEYIKTKEIQTKYSIPRIDCNEIVSRNINILIDLENNTAVHFVKDLPMILIIYHDIVIKAEGIFSSGIFGMEKGLYLENFKPL